VHLDRTVSVFTDWLGKSGINVHYCVLFENVEKKNVCNKQYNNVAQKKAIDSFKLEWLKVIVTTDTPYHIMFRLN
jgi:hypothetical protein